MTQEKRALLQQIYTRLCFHAGANPERFNHKRERFIANLIAYPEDLLCAAYYYVMAHLTPLRLPSEEEFISFMGPEYSRRNHLCKEDT